MSSPSPLRNVLRRLPLGARRRIEFAYTQRRIPRFNRPLTFSEKINWRILHDRRPQLAWTCDKLSMKEHAAEVPGLRIPQTLWSGLDLRELNTVDLPEHWVLKPNHRSQLVHFGTGRPDIPALLQLTESWLTSVQSELGEWAYAQARPMFFVEEMLTAPGAPPTDYKFLVFDGRVHSLLVNTGRFVDHHIRFYRPDWTPMDATLGGFKLGPILPRPVNLDDMLTVAGRLGRPFDFIRIDLYSIDGQTVFGEYTPYPQGGLEAITPLSYDRELGDAWTLPDLSSRP